MCCFQIETALFKTQVGGEDVLLQVPCEMMKCDPEIKGLYQLSENSCLTILIALQS